jgi:DNA-binding MurR/RpiR family transcriptional regulator
MKENLEENMVLRNTLVIVIAYEDVRNSLIDFVRNLERQSVPVLLITGPFGYPAEKHAIRVLHNRFEKNHPGSSVSDQGWGRISCLMFCISICSRWIMKGTWKDFFRNKDLRILL